MIDYEEEWIAALLFKANGSLIPRACWIAIPSCLVTLGLQVYKDYEDPYISTEDLGIYGLGGSQIWNALTVVLTLLLGFRTRQGLMRFWQGTGLLHQMRGEWFDTVSNCVTFSISAKKTKAKQVDLFRHALVRLMSRCHGSALEEIAENSFQLEGIDTFGLDNGTLNHLRECHDVYGFNKVEVMLHLVQSLITRAHDDGILKIPPPILSRVYQTISRGFVNLLNAKKITDTRFPFPYAQLIAFLLICHIVVTPFVMISNISNKFFSILLTFVPIVGMTTLNFIAIELENPFGTDDNDLPMTHFQDEMNRCLLMLLHPNTDMITGTSPECVLDFEELLEKFDGHREAGTVVRLSTVSYRTSETEGKSGDNEAVAENKDEERKTVKTESIRDHSPPDPAGAASGQPAIPSTEAFISKGIDEFESSFKLWMQSVQAQVTQLNESFDALKTFNETTSQMILETHWPNPENSVQSEGGGWQIAISPI